MRTNAIVVLALCVVVSLASAAAWAGQGDGFTNSTAINPQTGQASMEAAPTNCNLVTFEGLADNAPIGVIPGPVTVTFGASWFSLIDGDDGGSGNFANEPSSMTAAAYPYDQNDIRISLSPSVQHLEFFYSAALQSLPVTVTAYDATDAVVDVAVGNVIGTGYDGADCVGDPNGDFCKWASISLTTATDNIAYVEISGTVTNFFGIDNLIFCTTAQPEGACCLPDGTCQLLNQQSCEGAGGMWDGSKTCDPFPCALPVEKTTWGKIKSLYSE